MYIDHISDLIRKRVPSDRLPTDDVEALFRAYAVLLRAKGPEVTNSDVHDAWCAWMARFDAEHPSLVPYEQLAPEVRVEDQPYTRAIQDAARELHRHPTRSTYEEILFPFGPPKSAEDRKGLVELYRIMVESSESLVRRRQGLNTFFLTMNGALLAAAGVLVQGGGAILLRAIGVAILSFAGLVLCLAWYRLIVSFGQLNTGKFKVINSMERHLGASIYAAEWEALARGENPAVYSSFTSREIWVPIALIALSAIVLLASIAVACGWIEVVPAQNAQTRQTKHADQDHQDSVGFPTRRRGSLAYAVKAAKA